MKFPPLVLAAVAGMATLAISQSLIPTAKAQSADLPQYRVRIDWQKARQEAGGLTVRGLVTNTGRSPLIYTQVTPTLVNGVGRVVYRTDGYLTVSPLLPGASAEFRACGPKPPVFTGLHTAFHEAGKPVAVQEVTPKH